MNLHLRDYFQELQYKKIVAMHVFFTADKRISDNTLIYYYYLLLFIYFCVCVFLWLTRLHSTFNGS